MPAESARRHSPDAQRTPVERRRRYRQRGNRTFSQQVASQANLYRHVSLRLAWKAAAGGIEDGTYPPGSLLPSSARLAEAQP